MAVSKRVRFEVLKRDSHTCRYCGASAPDVKLTVDHVTPVVLGGSDLPENLVAACQDCNSGKASTSLGDQVVADVKQIDLMWAGAIARVAQAREAEREKRRVYVAEFDYAWECWHYGWDDREFPRPANYQAGIERFYELGVPIEEIKHCVRIACGNDRIAADATYRYFAGCVWRTVTEMQDAAKALLTVDASEVD